jgi:hypothetical protein
VALTPQQRAELGIHAGPPTTGVEERLEALIVAVQSLAAALQPPQPVPEPADDEPRAVTLREPETPTRRRKKEG